MSSRATHWRAKPIIDLPELPATRRRIRFGVLVATIDATAPPARRALARYLCVYAELAGISPTELAIRADIATTVTTDILAGRLIPTTTHATRLAAVLNCEPDTLRHLTNAASSATAVDEHFWIIANTVNTTPSPDPMPPSSNLSGRIPTTVARNHTPTRQHHRSTPSPTGSAKSRSSINKD